MDIKQILPTKAYRHYEYALAHNAPAGVGALSCALADVYLDIADDVFKPRRDGEIGAIYAWHGYHDTMYYRMCLPRAEQLLAGGITFADVERDFKESAEADFKVYQKNPNCFGLAGELYNENSIFYSEIPVEWWKYSDDAPVIATPVVYRLMEAYPDILAQGQEALRRFFAGDYGIAGEPGETPYEEAALAGITESVKSGMMPEFGLYSIKGEEADRVPPMKLCISHSLVDKKNESYTMYLL